MQIEDLDSKTTLSPHLVLDPRCILCCVTVSLQDSALDPVQQCSGPNLHAMYSSLEVTLSPDLGSGSTESSFSAHVECPIVICPIFIILVHVYHFV